VHFENDVIECVRLRGGVWRLEGGEVEERRGGEGVIYCTAFCGCRSFENL